MERAATRVHLLMPYGPARIITWCFGPPRSVWWELLPRGTIAKYAVKLPSSAKSSMVVRWS